MSSLAPIVLFVYNRPWHTQQTLEALEKNDLAKESILYIYADGAKEGASEKDVKKIEEVKKIVKSRKWCGEQELIIRKRNWGLAENIIDGVTNIVNKHGQIIVLEDDLVTSKGFLKFMNDALNIYKNEDKVMHISGYMFPVKKKLPPTFFYNTASSWGWATWKESWNLANFNASDLLAKITDEKEIERFNIKNSYPFYAHLKANAQGSIKTWAVKWYANIFINNGYSLHPYPSLVNNIGFDGQGENCDTSNNYNWTTLIQFIEVTKIEISESRRALMIMQKFNKNIAEHNYKRLREFKKNMIKVLPERIKALLRKKSKTLYKQNRELNRIKKLPRFEKGYTSILGPKIEYIDSASFIFIYDEIFSKKIYNFFTSLDSPIIIDAGANIGLASLYFKKEYPNSNIIAFEPDIAAYRALNKNMNEFGYNDVELINKALWSSEVELDFFHEGADGGRISNISDVNSTYKVKTVRLRDYLEETVDFLKIDIEGAEIKVLTDCADLLSNVKNIFVEFHSFLKKDQELSILLALLEEAGFRYYIEHVGVTSNQPLLQRNHYLGMDNQLNIYGYRKK